MKKHLLLFSLLVSFIAALLPTTASALPTSGQRGFITWQKSGGVNAIQYGDIDSITYSRVGLDGKTYPNVVVQVVWTQDSVYRIPIADVDTIALKAPDPVENDNVFHIRDFHYPYVTDVTDLTVTFDASIPTDSLPRKGQVVISDRAYVEPFLHGFAGRVDTVLTSGDAVRIVCTEATLKDVFKELLIFGNIVATSEDSVLTRMSKRAINGQGDTTIYIDTKHFNLYSYNNSHISLDVTPTIKIKYNVHISLLQKDIFQFWADNTLKCDFDVNWNPSIPKPIDETVLMKKPLTVQICPGFSVFFNIGGFIKLDGEVKMGVKRTVYLYSQLGYDSESQGPDPDHEKDNGLQLHFDPPVWEDPVGYVDCNASLSAGAAFQLGACIGKNDWLNINLTLKAGPKLEGKLGFSTNASTLYKDHYEDGITFTPVAASLYGGVQVFSFNKEWPLGELPLTRWFPNVDLFQPRTVYLFPNFNAPHLPSMSYEQHGYSLTALTTGISRNLLFSVTPGIRIKNTKTGIIYTKYSSNQYKKQYEPFWFGQSLQMELKNYPAGTYTAKPIFTLFGKVIEADTTFTVSTVQIPYSLSAPTSWEMIKGETDTIPFSGGWGNYSISLSNVRVCADILPSKDGIRVEAKKTGSTTITLTDKRSHEEKKIPVTVNAPEPTIIVDSNSLTFGDVRVGNTIQRIFNVKGKDLTGDITLSSNLPNVFKIIDPETKKITKAQAQSTDGANVTVEFEPQGAADYNASITLTSKDADSQNVTLKGKGVQPSISVTPASGKFGTVVKGDTAYMDFKVNFANLSEPLSITRAKAEVNKIFMISKKDVNKGTFTVRFKPTKAGDYTDTIFVSADGLIVTVPLTGKCVDPYIKVTPDTVDFGTLEKGKIKYIDCTVSTNVSNLSISREGAMFIVSDRTNLDKGEFTVRFKPTKAGNYTGTVILSGNGKSVTVPLIGRGVSITTNPTSGDFGPVLVGKSKTIDFKINCENISGPLSITRKGDMFIVSKKDLEQGTFTVRYTPTELGNHTGSIIVKGDGIRDTVPLTGMGMQSTIIANPDTIDFGTTTKGDVKSLTFTVNGICLTGDLTLESTNHVFKIDKTTISKEQAESTDGATVIVTYQPDSVTYNGGFIKINGGGAEEVKVKLNGRCVRPTITVTPASGDFGTVYKDNSKYTDFTVSTNVSQLTSITREGDDMFVIYRKNVDKGTFTVRYRPSEAGYHQGSIIVKGIGITETVPLTGFCPPFTVDQDTIRYGNVPVDSAKTSTITVTGVNLTKSLTLTTSNHVFKLGENKTRSVKITPAQAANGATILVTYEPDSVCKNGGYINITGGGMSDTVKISLQGRGVNPTITVIPDSIGFGNVAVGNSKTATFTVKGSTLAGDLTLSSSNPTRFSVDATTLTPNENGTVNQHVTVTYKPTEIQNNGGFINIDSYGAQRARVKLTGKGVKSANSVSPTP